MGIEVWIILAVIFFIFEIVTNSFFTLWFGVGSIIVALTNYLGFNIDVQFIVFIIVSLVLILCSKKFQMKVTKETDKKAVSDRLIGKTAIVLKRLNSEEGIVKIEGEEWVAYLKDNIDVDDRVKVTGISSIKLIVEKID